MKLEEGREYHEHRREKVHHPDERAPGAQAGVVGGYVKDARGEVGVGASGGEGDVLVRDLEHDHGEGEQISPSK